MHPHYLEELDYQASRGDRLWDADPDVCCGAFQLGACSHTENAQYEEQREWEAEQYAAWRIANPEEAARDDALLAAAAARRAGQLVEEPF